MRKALDVGESQFEFLQDLQYALRIMLRAQTFWNLISAFIRAVYKSNRSYYEIQTVTPRIYHLTPNTIGKIEVGELRPV